MYNPFIKDGKLYGQDFNEIKASCLRDGALFEDKHFPPTARSVYYSRNPDQVSSYVTWFRPHQICEEPQLVEDGADRHDINQGELGDCWLLASISSLTIDKNHLENIMPPGQSFKSGYAGIFLFRFWQYGEWVEVVVDDCLPTRNGKLIFLHSDSKSEFWSALLEKAFAKLHGSYENLLGGKCADALVDFTGGCPESYSLERSKVPNKLFSILLKSMERKSLTCCSISADPYTFEARTPTGLVKGHAYTLTKVLQLPNGQQFVRVRNPWGNEQEWKGKWSDRSKEWDSLSPEDRKLFGLTFDSDGEWWMEYEDFLANFDEVEMCHLCPEKMLKLKETVFLDVKSWHGKWVEGVSAGGCRNFLSSFITNPQYTVTLNDVDEDDDDNLCTLMVSLMQKRRRMLKDEGKDNLSIGFVIYRLKSKEQAKTQLGEEFFKYTMYSAMSDSFSNAREVTGRFRLPPGNYVIVPSTFHPDTEGEFLLRAFTEKLRGKDGKENKNKIDPSVSKNDEPMKNKKPREEKEHDVYNPDNDSDSLEKIADKKQKGKDKVKKEAVTAPANDIDGERNTIKKSKTEEKHPNHSVCHYKRSEDKEAIHRFKYEDEKDEKWACITSPGTTIITIATTGSNVITITLMDI